MRILSISDTHNKHNEIPEKYLANEEQLIDMIIHGGDVSSRGYEHEIDDFLEWFSRLNFKYKIFIAGNHDFFFERAHELIIEQKLAKYPNIIYLNDSGVEIEGVKIWGSPIQPFFYNWAFNRDEDKIQEHWALIPNDTEILIVHGGPKGVGRNNLTQRGEEVGCPYLTQKINELKKLKLFVQGHIHESYGCHVDGDKVFINASLLNLNYEMQNRPITLDLGDIESVDLGRIR